MNLKSLTQPELADILKALGQPKFRAKQVYTWLHTGARSYSSRWGTWICPAWERS